MSEHKLKSSAGKGKFWASDGRRKMLVKTNLYLG